MKIIYAIVTLASALSLSACKKGGAVVPAGSIVGKWYVVKEELKEITGGVSKTLDTIYTAAAFNTNDYFQFNRDSTAVQSSSGDFTIWGKSVFTTGQGSIIFGTNTYIYSLSGQTLTLKSTFLHPTPNSIIPDHAIEIILFLDGKNLTIRSSSDPAVVPQLITDTYYRRGD